MLEPRLIGRTARVDGRRLYLATATDLESMSLKLEEPIGQFVAFVALDTRRLSGERLAELAQELLDAGCVYMCSWGPDASRIHDVFDEKIVEAELAGRPYVEDLLMTAWHAEESLDDALWCAVFVAFPPEEEARAVLAVCDPEWSGEIESRFADSEQWNAQVLKAEGAAASRKLLRAVVAQLLGRKP
jgi:hypothetical protein